MRRVSVFSQLERPQRDSDSATGGERVSGERLPREPKAAWNTPWASQEGRGADCRSGDEVQHSYIMSPCAGPAGAIGPGRFLVQEHKPVPVG